MREDSSAISCRVAVIWIDWYAYHLARFEGLQSAFGRQGEVVGIELVGGAGVHTGFVFRESRQAGMPIETLLPQSSWGNASKFKLACMLWKRLSQLKPEMLLVPGYYTVPAVAAAVWAKFHGRISVLMTESTAGDHVRKPWKEDLKSFALRLLFDWAVTGGRAHVRYLQELRFPQDRIVGFYNVVGNQSLQKATAEMRANSSHADRLLPKQFFLYVGRLAPEKNVTGLLQSWMAYRKQGGTRSLVLVGDGPEASALREHVATSPYALDVVFAGHQSACELIPFFSFAACFVLPSTREPWGLVVNEAMASALPVIVSNRCGCAEDLVQDGGNGFLFDPLVEDDLTVCLLKLDHLSADQLSSMGTLSTQRIASYSPEHFGTEIASIANATQTPSSHPRFRRASEPSA